jgi:integrase/recombinase XerD
MPVKKQLKEYSAKQFSAYLKSNGYAEKTIMTYLFHIDKVQSTRLLDNLTYKQIILIISDPSFSIRYRQVIVAALKQYYHYLVWAGIRESHPCPNLRIRSNYSQNFLQHDFLTSEELGLIRNRIQRYPQLELRDKVLLSLLTIQGLAPIELTGLNLKDVNLNRRTLRITQNRKYRQRSLNLLPEQIDLIVAYIHSCRNRLCSENEQALLVGMTGKRMTTDSIHYIISTMKYVVPDKQLTPQLIRQSVITWWINDLKIPLEQVQLMSGHRWISSTQKYEFRKMSDELALVNRWQ